MLFIGLDKWLVLFLASYGACCHLKEFLLLFCKLKKSEWHLNCWVQIFILIFFYRYALINAAIIYVYSITFQKIDEDEYGGIWDIIKEGFMTSFSTFLVLWIVVYSAFYNNNANYWIKKIYVFLFTFKYNHSFRF